MIDSTSSLYSKVLKTTYRYLGPASERFINRQISNHIGKHPEDLERRDLSELINWIEVSMTVLTNDQELISEYIGKLKALTKHDRVKS